MQNSGNEGALLCITSPNLLHHNYMVRMIQRTQDKIVMALISQIKNSMTPLTYMSALIYNCHVVVIRVSLLVTSIVFMYRYVLVFVYISYVFVCYLCFSTVRYTIHYPTSFLYYSISSSFHHNN
jgi:hypothetical protein